MLRGYNQSVVPSSTNFFYSSEKIRFLVVFVGGMTPGRVKRLERYKGCG
jgi:hypothetical protein